MRYSWLALAAALLAAATAAAQQPPQSKIPPAGTQPAAPPAAPPPAVTLDPARNPLDAHLLRWEKEMTSVQTLLVQATRTENKKTFGYTDQYQGTAKYMKVPLGAGGPVENLATLTMEMKGKPEIYERFVCTGSHLYQFVPQQKEVRVYQLPPPKQGQIGDDSFLSFLFGMKAEEARRRYEMRLAKEDQHYVYVEIFPRFPADKADFQRARLVLNRDTYLPRQLWFEQPNGDEVMWDLPRVQAGVPLDRKEFIAPQAPQGWRMVQQTRNNPTDVPPRVYRPNN